MSRWLAAWVSRRWRELGQRPSGNAVPGTVSVAVLAGLAGLARVLLAREDLTAYAPRALGVGCLVAAAIGLHHLVARLGLGRPGRLLALGVLLVNPDLGGVVSRPREALLVAGVMTALAGLARWARATRTPSGGELTVYVGAPATVAVFAGYEGWVLVLLGLAVVAAVQLSRGQGARSALTRAGCVAAVPLVIGGWWLLRSLLRGRALDVVLPDPQPTLTGNAAVSLLCLLIALPVLAGVAALVRDQLARPAALEREPLVHVDLPHQRQGESAQDGVPA